MTERERAYKLLTDIHFHSSSSVRAEKILAAFRDVQAEVWEEAADYHEKLLALCGRDEWRERIRHEEEVKYLRQRAISLREGRDDYGASM